eukprot:IDg5792t1
MDVLDREQLVADTVFNRLARRSVHTCEGNRQVYVDEWYIPLIRSSSRHVYVPLHRESQTLFTRSQLFKLHRQFFHPSAGKLFNLLKRARSEHATPETLAILQDISNRCDPCQRIRPAPVRFRVSFGTENAKFNERIILDIMYIDSHPVLHIVDEGTRFSAARFLPSIDVEAIWDTLLRSRANVEVQATGTESHSSLNIGERYHQPLRSTFRKMALDYPQVDKGLLLQLAVKSMNDTLGPEGIVPSSLVFGEYPKVYTTSETPQQRPSIAERAKMLHTARIEMQKHMAKSRIARALKHSVPPAADNHYQPGDQVL